MSKKRFVYEYDSIRIIAVILVVIGHLSSLAIPRVTGNYNPFLDNSGVFNSLLEILRRFIYGFHMPLFMILSGAVFSTSFKKCNLYFWIKKKAKRLLVPYWITALFLLIPIRFIINYYSSGFNIIDVVVRDTFLSLDVNYLWYILVLFELSVFFAIFSKITLSNNRKMQFILVFTLFFVSTLSLMLVNSDVLIFQINRTIRYSFWFYCGILLDKYIYIFKKYSNIKNIYFVGIIYIIGFCLFTSFEFILSNNVFSKLGMIVVKCLKMLIRYFMMEGAGSLFVILFAFKIQNMNKLKFLRVISKYSLYVYLIHCPVAYILKMLIIKFIPVNIVTPIIYFLLLVILFVLCLCLSIFFSKMIFKINNLFKNREYRKG